jgi:hypothetical protein
MSSWHVCGPTICFGRAATAPRLRADGGGVRKPFLKRSRPLVLPADTSFSTGCGNDCQFERIFERQVESLDNAWDVLVAISTSGNSPTVLNRRGNRQGHTRIVPTRKNRGRCLRWQMSQCGHRAPIHNVSRKLIRPSIYELVDCIHFREVEAPSAKQK